MKNKILEKILIHSKKTKSLIGIRKYNEGDDFWLGYIVDFNEELIVLQHISKLGVDDGLLIEKIDNIESFETGDEYIKSYEFLYKNSSKVDKQTIKSVELPNSDSWQYDLLKNKFDKNKIVTIELNNSDTITHGFIIDFDETHFQFQPISNLGEEEGFNIYKISDISSLAVDRLESRKRQAFYNWRKKKA